MQQGSNFGVRAHMAAIFVLCSVKEVGGFYSWKTFPEFCADETSQDRYCTSRMIKHVSLGVIFLLLKQQKYFTFLVRHVDVVSLTCLYNPYVNFSLFYEITIIFRRVGIRLTLCFFFKWT